MKRAIIFINGNLSDLKRAKKIILSSDYIICADGGTRQAFKLGLKPDLVIGDFDSIEPDLYNKLISQNIKLIKYPRKKDETDFELTIHYALEKKFGEIIIFGILGDRLDHLFSNILHLAKIQSENKTLRIKIVEGNKNIYIFNKKIAIKGNVDDEISIIPVSAKLENIVTDGLVYKLDHESLIFGTTRGVSNVMNKRLAKISSSKGIGIIEHNIKEAG